VNRAAPAAGSGAGEDEQPEDACAGAFLAAGGGVIKKRVRGPGKGKVDVFYESRPFAVEGCGIEAFFAHLNATNKAKLHQIFYELGYVWEIASFKNAPYNLDESTPCQFRAVVEYLQPGRNYVVDNKPCATRKVWLAAHLWPASKETLLAQNKITGLTGGQQNLLKKYVTGINQATHLYNDYMATQAADFAPLATSAPPPSRKAVKRDREDESEGAEGGEGDGEDAQPEQAESDDDGGAQEPSTPPGAPPPIVPVLEVLDEPADEDEDEEMPEAVADDAEPVD
jgi:hypothetical protein